MTEATTVRISDADEFDPEDKYTGSKARILDAAERLFAENGFDAVGVREVAKAAGHKNANSVTYHFGTKDNLLSEVLERGFRVAADWRRQKLSELTEDGRVPTNRDLLKVLLAPTIERHISPSFARLVAQVIMTGKSMDVADENSDLYWAIFECNRYLCENNKNIPEEIMLERISLFHIYISMFQPTRDIRIESGEDSGRWASRHIVEHFLDTGEAMLTAPVNPDTAKALRAYFKKPKYTNGRPADSIEYKLF